MTTERDVSRCEYFEVSLLVQVVSGAHKAQTEHPIRQWRGRHGRGGADWDPE